MKAFVTGAAGFIGSNLVDRLLKDGCEVIGYDNLSTGKKQFLKEALKNKKFRLIEADILDLAHLTFSSEGCDIVFHLAANADIKNGLSHPTKDLQQNIIGTSKVLEAMRINNIKRIVFSSTGSVYGEAKQFPTLENTSFPIQTSLYGASKLAGEGLIQAYCEGYEFQAYIFRFVSVLGERYTHGHVRDFYEKLLKNPKKLEVLGNGNQTKSYIYIQDLIEAILTAIPKANEKVNIFNLGTDEFCSVRDSIKWITKELQLSPKIIYEEKNKGWVGDNPFIYLDTKKIRITGWKPKLTIKQSIIKTIKWLEQNKWVLK